MNYCNESVYRQNRTLDEETAFQLLRQGEYGVLSMADTEGGGYGIPLNYVWDGAHSLYMHCATEGRKLRNLKACPDVSFVVIGPTQVIPEKFTTLRSSIVLWGKAHTQLPEEEKQKALTLFLEKFCPNMQEAGQKYAETSLLNKQVEIIRLDVSYFTGKGNIR